MPKFGNFKPSQRPQDAAIGAFVDPKGGPWSVNKGRRILEIGGDDSILSTALAGEGFSVDVAAARACSSCVSVTWHWAVDPSAAFFQES